MSRPRKIVIAVGVLVLGVCAAMPFYRADNKKCAASASHAKENVPWRGSGDIPLQVMAVESQSLPQKEIRQVDEGNGLASPARIESEDATSDQEETSLPEVEPEPQPKQEDPKQPNQFEQFSEPPYAAVQPEQEKLNHQQIEDLVPVTPRPEQENARSHQRPILDPKIVPSIQPHEEQDRANAALTKHVIVDGDTLPDLADRYLGDRSLHLEIFKANPKLPSPRVLPIGMEIVIPQVETSP